MNYLVITWTVYAFHRGNISPIIVMNMTMCLRVALVVQIILIGFCCYLFSHVVLGVVVTKLLERMMLIEVLLLSFPDAIGLAFTF